MSISVPVTVQSRNVFSGELIETRTHEKTWRGNVGQLILLEFPCGWQGAYFDMVGFLAVRAACHLWLFLYSVPKPAEAGVGWWSL